MDDDQIRAALNEFNPDEAIFVEIVRMGGIEPSGDLVTDVRALAAAYDLDPEGVLYGLFSEDSPLYKEEQ